jgi:fructosamine-3-kinase
LLDEALAAIAAFARTRDVPPASASLRALTRARGGRVSEAVHLSTGAGDFLLKWNADPRDGRFEDEALALECLAATGAVRVPRALAARNAQPGGAGADATPGFLVLEWLSPLSPEEHARRAGRSLGETLAALHAARSLGTGALPLDRFATGAALLTAWKAASGCMEEGAAAARAWSKDGQGIAADWVAFYRTCLFLPLLQSLDTRGSLSAEGRRAFERLDARLPALLGGMPWQPSLLHGDLHRWNVVCAPAGDLALIDPQPLVGEREMELAYAEQGSGLAPAFFDTYWACLPALPGRRERRALYALLDQLRAAVQGTPGALEKAVGTARLCAV